MRKLPIPFMLILVLSNFMLRGIPAAAQEMPYLPAQIAVESAFLRAAPSADASSVASVFRGDSLNVVGRNVDGSWFQIARPEGWISRRTLIFTFDPLLLPLTDVTTGVDGETPVVDSGFAVQVIDDTALYVSPERNAAINAEIPIYALLPALERTPDNQWIAVNYRGIIGWLPQFLTRHTFAVSALPISAAYTDDPRYPQVVVIPVETQLAQIDRLLSFIEPLDRLADGIASYWDGLRSGQILECRPFTETLPYYPISDQDRIELPELRQQERLLRQAVGDLNAALLPTQSCGIVISVDFNAAYADANNARTIFRLVRRRMDALRERIEPTLTPQTGSPSE